MRRSALLLALLSLPLAAPAAPGPAPVEARPDGEGGFLLSYDVTRAAPGPVALRLLVARDDAGDAAHGERALPPRDLPAGTTRVEVAFLPAEGPGDYAVSLAADGHAGASLRFRVDAETAATADVTWRVPDEPTTLALLDDTVNADGKLKSPGEAVVTRARLTDGNGVGDVHALRWFVLRGSVVVEQGALPVDAPANATGATVEHRYARSPLAAGEHALLLRAEKDGAPVAEVRRTFLVREVAPTLAALHVPNVTPDQDQAVLADAVLADRNDWSGEAPVEARVYRGSTRVDGRALNLSLLPPRALPDEAGAARVAYPLRLDVPANATPGAHRVSVYVNGTLLGSAPFEVLPLPRLLAAAATPGPDGVRLDVALSGPGLLDVRLDAGDAVLRSTHALAAGDATLHVPAPSGDVAWSVTLRAREGGPALGGAEGRLHAAAPLLSLHAVRPPPRTPALWDVRAPGWDLAGATANATLHRWDGARVDAPFTFDGGRLALDARLEPGRYALDVELRLPNGTRARAAATFDAGPWVRVALGEPVVAAGEARVPVRNLGAPVRGLVVEVEGLDARPALHVGSAVLLARASGARHAFDAPLATDAEATLVLPLPEGPQPSGTRTARVRVLALGGGGA